MELFTEISNGVVEFLPTNDDDQPKQYTTASTLTDPSPLTIDKGTTSTEVASVETQTTASELSGTVFPCVDEEKLLRFLQNVCPLVLRELESGLTPIYPDDELSEGGELSTIDVEIYQKIQLPASSENQLAEFTFGAAVWLAICTQNAPMLAISCAPNHYTWCDHQNAKVVVFLPKRKKSDNDVEICWEVLKTMSVKACIQSLKTNPFNKRIFAGGTVSGDLYVWCCENENNKDLVNELFSESTQNGAIVGIDWVRLSSSTSSYGVLTCHDDGYVILWKIGQVCVRHKTLKISWRVKDHLMLSAIVAVSDAEFVVGTKEGFLLFCSIAQLKVLGDNNIHDPVLYEMQSHEFGVRSLQKIVRKNKPFLVSCDLGGTVYIQGITSVAQGDTSDVVLRLPLDFKHHIVSTSTMEHILSPGPNGTVEILQISNGTKVVIGNEELNGPGEVIDLSGNGSWLVTGCYEGAFQIFHIAME